MSHIISTMTTDVSVTIGATHTGAIETVFGQDLFKLDLEKGETVRITLAGAGPHALADPVLDLYDATGALMAWNFDAHGDATHAEITFEAEATGSYFIEAYGSGPITGTYALTVARAGPTPLEAIDWGAGLATSDVRYYLAEPGDLVLTRNGTDFTSEGWNVYEIQQLTKALDRLEAISQLTFERVFSADDADLVMGLDTDGDMGAGDVGFFQPPTTPNAGRGMFNGRAWDRSPGGDLEIGGVGFATLTHELLHGLGFAHPHDTGGSSSEMVLGDDPGVDDVHPYHDYAAFDLNQGVYTAMSYNTGAHTLGAGHGVSSLGLFGAQAGPMALDIALLQARYGANMTTATGNDTYSLPRMNQLGTGWQSIWDAGGIDTITYGGLRPAVIDLRPATLAYEPGGGGFVSAVQGVSGGFTIAHDVVIENAISGHGNDRIIGNGADNMIVTRKGHDHVRGGAGADTIQTGVGDDIVFGGMGDDLIRLGGGDDWARGNRGDDLIIGAQGNDRLFGGPGDDVIRGGAGNDRIVGGRGDDRLYGGPGHDTIRGGKGDDIVTLGAGRDRFIFTSGDGTDRITDFDRAHDTLVLDPTLLGSGGGKAALLALARWTPEGVGILFGDGDAIFLDGLETISGLGPAITFDWALA